MGLGFIQSLPPRRGTVKFIAELFEPDQWPVRTAIAPNNFDRKYDIYSFSLAPHVTDPLNYWIAWGGTFDNPTNTGLQIFMNVFLTQVFIESALLETEKSFYIDEENYIVYMNLPLNPWQYFSAYSSLYGNVLSTFATAPKNENNLSDQSYGAVKVRTVMNIPRLEVELSNAISGFSIYDTFEFSAKNHDGYYDGFNIINYFNTPLKISKSSENPQLISDFNQIRYGIVNDISVDFSKVQIKASDQFYLMKRSFCNTFSKTTYPNISDSDENGDIPVAWGPVTGIKPTQVDKDTSDPATWIDYIALDPDYITSVEGVYDENGNALTHSFNATTGIIRVTEVDGDGEVIEAEYMNVTGDTDNLIGEVIINALERAENVSYIEGVWDLTETDYYLTICPEVGLYFPGGTTKELIEKALQNDMVFLIQKHDGLLSLRRWGVEYDTHQIPSWTITQKPKKNFEDATKYYCSSVKVRYSPFLIDDDTFNASYLNSSMEASNFERWRKSYLAEFDTDLLYEADAIALSANILDRFGEVRETIDIGLAVDTFQVNLLDRIEIDVNVNDRRFSSYSSWVVKACDPGQDTLSIEGLDTYYALTFDDIPASLDDVLWYVSGIM